MNGYPEWTPASNLPNESGRYYVTFQRIYDGKPERFAQSWDFDGSKWDMPTCGTQIIAWIPLPPAYEPPKFGWHPASDPPTRDGRYILRWLSASSMEEETEVGGFKNGKWNGVWDNSVPLWWSHIEPTPEAHNET